MVSLAFNECEDGETMMVQKWNQGLSRVALWGLAAVVYGCLGCSKAATENEQLNVRSSDPTFGALLKAIERDDLPAVDRIVSSGAAVNTHGEDGMTPLLWAMRAKSKSGFLWLLEHGADPDRPLTGASAALGYSVAHIAARVTDDPYWSETVLKHGGNRNIVAPSHFGNTQIFDAIQRKNRAALDGLIRAGADLNHQNEFGSPPLLDATNFFWFEGVYCLLEAGADYRIKEKSGFDVAAAVLDNGVGIVDESRRWRAKVLFFLDKNGVDWEAARKKCAEKGFKTLDVDGELRWAGLKL